MSRPKFLCEDGRVIDLTWTEIKPDAQAKVAMPYPPPRLTSRPDSPSIALTSGQVEGDGFDRGLKIGVDWLSAGAIQAGDGPSPGKVTTQIDVDRLWGWDDLAALENAVRQMLFGRYFSTYWTCDDRLVWVQDADGGRAWAPLPRVRGRLEHQRPMSAPLPDILQLATDARQASPPNAGSLNWAFKIWLMCLARTQLIQELAEGKLVDREREGAALLLGNLMFELGKLVTEDHLRHLHDASLRAGQKAQADSQTRSTKMAAVNVSKQRRVEERRQEVLAIVQSVLEAWSKDGTGLYKRAALVQAVIDKSAKRFDESNWRTLERDVKHLLEPGALEIPANLLKPRRSRTASAVKP